MSVDSVSCPVTEPVGGIERSSRGSGSGSDAGSAVAPPPYGSVRHQRTMQARVWVAQTHTRLRLGFRLRIGFWTVPAAVACLQHPQMVPLHYLRHPPRRRRHLRHLRRLRRRPIQQLAPYMFGLLVPYFGGSLYLRLDRAQVCPKLLLQPPANRVRRAPTRGKRPWRRGGKGRKAPLPTPSPARRSWAGGWTCVPMYGEGGKAAPYLLLD